MEATGTTMEHETQRQPRPVCPHCGFRHDDAWEWNFGPFQEGDSNGRQCERCGKEFDCDRVVDVSYTTKLAVTPNVESERGATDELKQ